MSGGGARLLREKVDQWASLQRVVFVQETFHARFAVSVNSSK